jgi:kynurenine formamidase
VVLLRTGWVERHEQSSSADFNTEPGLTVDAAEWLARAGVAVVGADNFAIEAMPFPGNSIFPVHQRLLRDFGIPLIEGLVLRSLADSGRSVFAFVAAPLPIVGATGSPLTPLAIL